jgi:hypothetical protein
VFDSRIPLPHLPDGRVPVIVFLNYSPPEGARWPSLSAGIPTNGVPLHRCLREVGDAITATAGVDGPSVYSHIAIVDSVFCPMALHDRTATGGQAGRTDTRTVAGRPEGQLMMELTVVRKTSSTLRNARFPGSHTKR